MNSTICSSASIPSTNSQMHPTPGVRNSGKGGGVRLTDSSGFWGLGLETFGRCGFCLALQSRLGRGRGSWCGAKRDLGVLEAKESYSAEVYLRRRELGCVYQTFFLYSMINGSGGYMEVGYVDTSVCGYVRKWWISVDLLLERWIHTE